MKFVLSLILLSACGQGQAAMIDSARADSLARAVQDSVNRAQSGYIVDSILPLDEQLRRFRAGLRTMPAGLVGGASSRGELVRSFISTLEARDTASLARLTISRAEFAYLVYPESPYSRRPYQQAPDLVWMRHAAASGTGLVRLLERIGGSRIGFKSMTCNPEPMVEGENRIWRDCVVRYEPEAGDSVALQLFAGIIEREGKFKILSYANAF